MSSVAVRKSGGASIVSIPKAILDTLGITVGSKLDLSIVDNKIVLSPATDDLSLEELLAGSPKERLVMSEEDKDWMQAKPVGKEIF